MAELQEKIKNKQMQRKKLIKQDKSLLPSGTCSKQQFYIQQSLNSLLGCPVFYDLTISTETKLCTCILVKKLSILKQSCYDLYWERTNRHLLSALKQQNNIGCNYIISCSKNPTKKQLYVGKLRGNFRNNQFNIYDGGQNPDKKSNRNRKQLGFIKYNQSSLFGRNQHSCSIILPKPQQTPQSTYTNAKYRPQQFTPQTSNQNLLQKQHQKNSSRVQGLTNDGSIIKNIKKLMINNMGYLQVEQNILVQRKDKQQALILVKRSQNSYYLKIGTPFNLVQGMAFAIAHLQHKLN